MFRNFCGNTLQDRKKRHRHSGVPLNFGLDRNERDPDLSPQRPIQDEIARRAVQDTMQPYVKFTSSPMIATPSLPPSHQVGAPNEDAQQSPWRNSGVPSMDTSNLLARSLSPIVFARLSWEPPGFVAEPPFTRTTLLTTLPLRIGESSPSSTPTVCQLFSILASNPNLRKLSRRRGSRSRVNWCNQ